MPTPETIFVCKQELQEKEKNLGNYIDNHPETLVEVLPKDREELIQAVDEQRKAKLNHQSSKSMLSDVRAAIEKINNGTFGTCVDCQNNIDDDRLRARPWVSRCKSCQEKKGVKIS